MCPAVSHNVYTAAQMHVRLPCTYMSEVNRETVAGESHLQGLVLPTVHHLQGHSPVQCITWHALQLIATQMKHLQLLPGQTLRDTTQPVPTQAQPFEPTQGCKALWHSTQVALLHDKLGESSQV